MSTLTKKEGIYTFVIVRAEKPKVERKPRERKPNRYKGILMGMKKLRIGDYIITDESIAADKIRQKVGNVKYCVTHTPGSNFPRRKFEFCSIVDTREGKTGYQVIIRRTV